MKELNFDQMAAVEGGGGCLLNALAFGMIAGAASGGSLFFAGAALGAATCFMQ